MWVFLDSLDLFLDLPGKTGAARDPCGACAVIELLVAPDRVRHHPSPTNFRSIVAATGVRLVGAVREADALGDVARTLFFESDTGNAFVKGQVVVLPPVAHAVEEN